MQGADPRIVGWWHDFQYPSRWRYPDLAPQQVLACRQFKLELATESELKRAAWLWNRRPRLILGYGTLSFVLMVSCTPMAILVPGVGFYCDAAGLVIWVLVIGYDMFRDLCVR